mmetsp:Transcript_3932/g.13763  ORF Transcript_3932/g.13763 Transcript_3932/m.13763 type:complete len:232 (-) Transcript_3932:50-745(-)
MLLYPPPRAPPADEDEPALVTSTLSQGPLGAHHSVASTSPSSSARHTTGTASLNTRSPPGRHSGPGWRPPPLRAGAGSWAPGRGRARITAAGPPRRSTSSALAVVYRQLPTAATHSRPPAVHSPLGVPSAAPPRLRCGAGGAAWRAGWRAATCTASPSAASSCAWPWRRRSAPPPRTARCTCLTPSRASSACALSRRGTCASTRSRTASRASTRPSPSSGCRTPRRGNAGT